MSKRRISEKMKIRLCEIISILAMISFVTVTTTIEAHPAQIAPSNVKEETFEVILGDEITNSLDTIGTYTYNAYLEGRVTRLEAELDEAITAADEAKAALDESTKQAAEEVEEEFSEPVVEDNAVEEETSPESPAEDIWYPSYYTAIDQHADENGALTEWQTNYFIAHNWSDNGQNILAAHEFVVVDGVKYRLDNSQIVSTETYYTEDLKAWATGNGRISFQTCCDGGYLIRRYTPC